MISSNHQVDVSRGQDAPFACAACPPYYAMVECQVAKKVQPYEIVPHFGSFGTLNLQPIMCVTAMLEADDEHFPGFGLQSSRLGNHLLTVHRHSNILLQHV